MLLLVIHPRNHFVFIIVAAENEIFLCFPFWRRTYDGELGRLSRMSGSGSQTYQVQHRRIYREKNKRPVLIHMQARELWPDIDMRVRRGGYLDTKEHHSEGLPDVRNKKSARSNKNLLQHKKICWDIRCLRKFYFCHTSWEKASFDKFSWRITSKIKNQINLSAPLEKTFFYVSDEPINLLMRVLPTS